MDEIDDLLKEGFTLDDDEDADPSYVTSEPHSADSEGIEDENPELPAVPSLRYSGPGLPSDEEFEDDEFADQIRKARELLAEENDTEHDRLRREMLQDPETQAVDPRLEFSDDGNSDVDQDDFFDSLREAQNFRPKSRNGTNKKGKRRGVKAVMRREKLSVEVKNLLSRGYEEYAARNYDAAAACFTEAIRLDNTAFSAFKTLGEIKAQQGDLAGCCALWIMAALLTPKDHRLWIECAELSLKLGLKAQAIRCYTQAIAADKTDLETVYRRALLYVEQETFTRAARSFQKLHQLVPGDANIVRELANAYVHLKRVNDAVQLYEDVLEANMTTPAAVTAGEVQKFSWSELNILAELYERQKAPQMALRAIKQIARWIQGRSDEKYWDDAGDDAEFDDRRFDSRRLLKHAETHHDVLQREFQLPLEIRAKLAVLRIQLGDLEEARRHAYKYLLRAEAAQYADLYLKVAEAYEDREEYAGALDFYTPLSYLEEHNSVALVAAIGRCLQETGDLEQAEEAYQTVLAVDPGNYDVLINLSELYYHRNELTKSRAILQQLSQLRGQDYLEWMQGGAAESDSGEEAGAGDGVAAFIVEKKRKRKLTAAQREQLERRQARREEQFNRFVLVRFQRLQGLWPKLRAEQAERASVAREWIQTAAELVDMFTAVPGFYPPAKGQVFSGTRLTRGRYKRLDIDTKIQRVAQLHDLRLGAEPLAARHGVSEFRGVSFTQWLDVFVQYALLLAEFEDVTDAYAVLRSAKRTNVFYQDAARAQLVDIAHVACALTAHDYREVGPAFRECLREHQFDGAVYCLFPALFPSGRKAAEEFCSMMHLKYFLRQIKTHDRLLLGREASGMATVTHKAIRALAEPVVPLLADYAMMLLCGRSYSPSLVYSVRAYAAAPRQPLLLLLMGVAHVHRAIQRVATNRHGQLLQGLSFLRDYHRFRSEDGPLEAQEADFNLGRAFHMLNLLSLADKFYRKVLEAGNLPGVGLAAHAAYNLHLIYASSGNMKLAQKVVEENLVIEI